MADRRPEQGLPGTKSGSRWDLRFHSQPVARRLKRDLCIVGGFMILEGTRQELIVKAAELIRDHIHSLLMKQERVVLAVPGGRNVAEIFRLLADFDIAWSRLDVFMLDERLVPLDHLESNFRQAFEILGRVLAEDQLHPFRFVPGGQEAGLAAYNDALAAVGGKVDIVLASSGEDGHIASLFPNHPSIRAQGQNFVLVKDAPKPPQERISASAHSIGKAGVGLVLFFGGEKRKALKNFLDPSATQDQCPAKIIAALPIYYVLTDQEVEEL